MALPLRHELKFQITRTQLEVLRHTVGHVLNLDPNAKKNGGSYHIRSLYFDTAFDDALYDKIAGVKDRDKYRIRIYNLSDAVIFMECKTKVGNLISKRSARISRDLAEQLMAADPAGLENTRSGLLRDVYREMRTRLLHPVVLVDYEREAYVHVAEEVRITFDMRVRTGLNSIDLFNPKVPTVPVLDHDETILEVKYNRVLPPYIRDLLSFACPEAVQTAVSKYTLCRKYEGKE
ncbi:MAG: polyphosphate polymerase domain-containing protein [Clostridia bacterium]|jgi:SPX domain protein involved in polyphosphate accumulation|nr:polyphosphate polymerase domain-containing protein [Clostridia bacterium]